MITRRVVTLALLFGIGSGPVAFAQVAMTDVLLRYGVTVTGGVQAAFDSHNAPTVPVTPGAFATPLAGLTSATGNDRIAAAYTFGILAGWSGRAASVQEIAAAGQGLTAMIGSDDRRSRIAGARVAGRIFAAPFDRSGMRQAAPAGMVDALFALLNRDHEVDQLAAMDALGLLRETTAVDALMARYYFYRNANKRALAGGALEALARIGATSAVDVVKQAAADPWSEGRDATALAVAFARERLLKDGSMAAIRAALDDRDRRDQARGYLAELGAPVP